MNIKKAIAAALCAAMTAGVTGVTGCKSNEKNTEQIEDLVESYTEALNNLDSEGLLELTNWEDDDKDYEDVEELFDISFFESNYGYGFVNCVEVIASSIVIDYKSEDIDFRQRVLKGFAEISDEYRFRMKVIDATLSREEIWEEIKEAVDWKLKKRGLI